MTKKSFLVLNALLIMGTFLFSSCKNDQPKPPVAQSVKSITVVPTEMTLNIGEKKSFEVKVEPLGTKLNYSVDNPDVVKQEGLVVEGLKEGKAVITISAGDKNAKLNVTVIKKPEGEVKKDRMAFDFYIPTSFANMSEEKPDMVSSMATMAWENTPLSFVDDPDEKSAFQFQKKEEKMTDDNTSLFVFALYVHKAQGDNFIRGLGAFKEGAWEQVFGTDENAKSFLSIYTATENFKRDKMNDGNPIVLAASSKFKNVAFAVYCIPFESEGKKYEQILMEVFELKQQSGALSIDALNEHLKNAEAFKLSQKDLMKAFRSLEK